MATKRNQKAPSRRKKRRRTLPKILFILGYSAVLASLIAIYVMRVELRRFGIFGRQETEQQTPGPSFPSVASSSTNAAPAKQQTSQAGEITSEEKKQLEDILRAKNHPQ